MIRPWVQSSASKRLRTFGAKVRPFCPEIGFDLDIEYRSIFIRGGNSIVSPLEFEFMAATGWEILSSDEEVAAAHSVADLRFSYSGPRIWETLSNEDPSEDYASSFALYFLDPAELERLSPARYDFMHDHVASDGR